MTLSIDLNPDVLRIPYGDRQRILDAARGKTDLADLASGNPDAALPPFIAERAKAFLETGKVRYSNYWGVPELRAAIAGHLKKTCGIEADPENEILVTHGVTEGLYTLLRTLLRPGDEVITPSPYYGSYYIDTIACGARPVLLKLDEADGFQLDVERLEKAITKHTRAFVFGNPNNPLGIKWSPQVLADIAEVAKRHDLLVVVDEIYHDFYDPDPPVSIASLPGMRERTFTLNGFSKSYAMMGMRMGYLVGPAEVMAHIKLLHLNVVLYPSAVSEAAALAALECPQAELDTLRGEFRGKLELLYNGVSGIPGITCVDPGGGLYLFPNVKCFGRTSMDLAVDMIEKVGLITLPGTEFGPDGEGYLRLSVCANRQQIEQGLERLERYSRQFG
jgi:aminotransferase